MANALNKRFTIIAVILLILAVVSIWPYGFYQVLRWVVALSAIYNAYNAYESKQNNWVVIMTSIAILFNPISPIHLEKNVWVVIDIITSVIMLVSLKKIK